MTSRRAPDRSGWAPPPSATGTLPVGALTGPRAKPAVASAGTRRRRPKTGSAMRGDGGGETELLWCRPCGRGDVGESGEECVDGGLTVVDRGTLVLGQRDGAEQVLEILLGFEELGLAGALGGLEVAAGAGHPVLALFEEEVGAQAVAQGVVLPGLAGGRRNGRQRKSAPGQHECVCDRFASRSPCLSPACLRRRPSHGKPRPPIWRTSGSAPSGTTRAGEWSPAQEGSATPTSPTVRRPRSARHWRPSASADASVAAPGA